MKARNKTERLILRYSGKLPQLSDTQKRWAEVNCIKEEWAYSNRQRISHGSFYLLTTYKGWQVLRYFQVRAKFRYHKLVEDRVFYKECMQHWLNNGEYVFLALPRLQGWCNDAFVDSSMEVRHDYSHCSILDDPRTLGYDGIYVCRISKQFIYAYRDYKDTISKGIYEYFRALNTHTYVETLLRQDTTLLATAIRVGAAYDARIMIAVKIAKRYSYDISDIMWWDMVEDIASLGKDLHNPKIVCPEDLPSLHDYWMRKRMVKKRKIAENMEKLRQLAYEKRELVRAEEMRSRIEQQKETAKSLADIYINKRQKFFDIDISDGNIDIQALKSVEEFYEEGKEMCHCVFSNRYYDINSRPYCLILSAKVNGKRMETIEVDLKDYAIVQSRGKHNLNSEFHEKIISLINKNMNLIKTI